MPVSSQQEPQQATGGPAKKPAGDALLGAARQGCNVVLIVSVNGSKSWQGYAKVALPFSEAIGNSPQPLTFAGAGDGPAATRMGHPFAVVWLKRHVHSSCSRCQAVTHQQKTAALTNSIDDNRAVNLSRNLQELDSLTGERMCRLIDEEVEREVEVMRQLPSVIKQSQHFFRADEGESDAMWDDFFKEVSKVGRILYAGHVGSRCYNLHTPSSDVDMLVIVASPTGQLLSLRPPELTHKNRAGFRPDFTLHEVGLFAEMLSTQASGDTRMLETLFTDPRAVVAEAEEWAQLRAIRSSFLTKQAARKYLSELHGNKGLKKLESLRADGSDPVRTYKQFYLLFRLARLALQVAQQEKLELWHEGADRQLFMDIREGKFPFDRLREDLRLLIEDAERRIESSSLPEGPVPLDSLDSWLLPIRRAELQPVPIDPSAALLRSPPSLPSPSPLLGRILASSSPRLEPLFSGLNGSVVVYAMPTELFLSLGPRKNETTLPSEAYELARFSALLLKGNPNLIELLFLDDGEYASAVWRDLKPHRDSFVTQKVVRAVLGNLAHKAKTVQRAASASGKRADSAAAASSPSPPAVRSDNHLLLRQCWRLTRGTDPGDRSDEAMASEIEAAGATESRPREPDAAALDAWNLHIRRALF